MPIVTKEFTEKADALAAAHRERISALPDTERGTGTTYYVSTDGDDTADGMSEATAWKTLSQPSTAPLAPGDTVLFRRGDLFRGSVTCREGVTYAAYGTGEKPCFRSTPNKSTPTTRVGRKCSANRFTKRMKF